MESEISPAFQKWLRTCLEEEFGKNVNKSVQQERDSFEVSQKIIESKKMTDFMDSIKEVFAEQKMTSPSSSASFARSRTSLSFIDSDFSEDEEWPSPKNGNDYVLEIVEKISQQQPVHVKLSGYEILLRSDTSQVWASPSWEALLKALKDGILDDSRPVFEASLRMHAKMLGSLYPPGDKSLDVFVNLLNAFNGFYQSRKFHEILPSSNSGISFKIFSHEKLCRIMHLIIRHQEEVLKSTRSADKSMDDIMERLVSFLSFDSSGSVSSTKMMSPLNFVSVLEPRAAWSHKWNHSFLTRKILISALSKSPNLLKRVILCAMKGLEKSHKGISATVSDEINEMFISGETVETLTYLHCLNFLSQLYSYGNGRGLLSETKIQSCVPLTDFLIALTKSLDFLAFSDAANGIYEASRSALKYILEKPIVLVDARFYFAALNPAMRKNEPMIWPHIIDVLTHMLDNADGTNFLLSEYKTGSASLDKSLAVYPAIAVLGHASNLMKQPLSVINVEYISRLFGFIGGMFQVNRVFEILSESLQSRFLPAINKFYEKKDKYFIENEIKTQQIDSTIRNMLLKISSVPLALQVLASETTIFRELIQGSISPLRASWGSNEILSFVSNAAFFETGVEILKDLAPHVLSTLIIELAKLSEEISKFHDPWSGKNVTNFYHLLSMFSLNAKCFISFMTEREEEEDEENIYPASIGQLFQYTIKQDSVYHYLSLLSLKATIWNLDIFVYLLNILDFQDQLLKIQQDCIFEVEDEFGDMIENYIIDEPSLLRHEILSDSYFMSHKFPKSDQNPEDRKLFSKMPPPQETDTFRKKPETVSELKELLDANKMGMRDSSWVSQVKKAFKNSGNFIEHSFLINLIDQMLEAIPTADWSQDFRWEEECKNDESHWLPEEILAFDVTLHYSELNELPIIMDKPKYNLKTFIDSTYKFVKYEKPENFEGFDWFLSTVFIICSGDVERSKLFVSRMVKFSSIIFVWPALGKVMDKNNEEEAGTQLLFAQLLESIVNCEFPAVVHALKKNCGTTWWMICTSFMSQCFWCILPWNEIVNYLIVCFLYPPDYIIYYCTSLLNHCQYDLMQSIANGRKWPDHMVLHSFQCNDQMGYMDRLGKRYRGKILPFLVQRKLEFSEQPETNNF